MSDLYQQVLLEELAHPKNKGEIADADVIFHAVNASCGDDMIVYLKLDNTVVKDVKWSGSGCAISQATISLLSTEIIGKTIPEIFTITQQDLEQLIGVKEISVGRIKCLMLGLNAVQSGLRDVHANT
jgi:nitrogen fixation NifU-like protein